MKGDKLYNWKPKKHCEDCGEVLSRRKYTRCIKCSSKRNGKDSANWKGGITKTELYKRWYLDNKKRVQFGHRLRTIRKKGNGGTHTLEEWKVLKKMYNYMCLCCKRFEPEIKLSEDHIVPISLGGSNNISNIQPLCLSCNSRKSIKMIDYRNFLYAERGLN